MMEKRGLSIAHTTITRWIHQYGPELDKRIRRHLNSKNDSWKVDKTYIKVKGQWMDLYRAVKSDQKAAKRFLKKLCGLFMFLSLVSSPAIKIQRIQ
jgi:transposase, IS6 family